MGKVKISYRGHMVLLHNTKGPNVQFPLLLTMVRTDQGGIPSSCNKQWLLFLINSCLFETKGSFASPTHAGLRGGAEFDKGRNQIRVYFKRGGGAPQSNEISAKKRNVGPLKYTLTQIFESHKNGNVFACGA